MSQHTVVVLSGEARAVANKKSGDEPKKPQRRGVSLQVWIPEEIDDAIEDFARRTHRTKRGVILLALERLLALENRQNAE